MPFNNSDLQIRRSNKVKRSNQDNDLVMGIAIWTFGLYLNNAICIITCAEQNSKFRELVPHQVYIGIETKRKSGQEVDVFMVLWYEICYLWTKCHRGSHEHRFLLFKKKGVLICLVLMQRMMYINNSHYCIPSLWQTLCCVTLTTERV